ncbi:hypothetical protein IWW37_004994 [Coemansia sp. RSA 2050]|nr:hypothetical protein IWW37_004994 [Coemansia sp. RSA 2050]
MADYPEQLQTPISQIGRNFVSSLATSLGQTRSRLVNLMHDEAMRHNECSRKAARHNQLVPELVYEVAEYQAKEIPGSSGHKMDVVFFYAHQSMNINNVHIIVEAKLAGVGDPMDEKTFAQIADYQYCLWKKQRTRAFVPVFLVHGSQLDLVVFTRDRWYRTGLGPICHERQAVCTQDIKKVRLTMARLYYLITLPPESFGHICDVSQEQQHLRFAKIAGEDSIVAAVTSSCEHSADSVDITGYVERFVHPRGRLAHVFKTTFRMQKVILKLSWTPVDRTPEGAIYEVLESAGVEGIPRLFGRGLLKEDVFGFRLEYLILEDCGKQIGDSIASGNQGKLGCGELYNAVKDVVGQTLRCLAQARVKANILHRDISMGNIMVSRDGAVKIIDWGYAKVIDDASFDASDEATRDRRVLLDTIAKRWRYDSAKVLQNEDDHDPLTGTPLYMSIPVLAGAKKRGLADDIESLFYVILHALTKLQTTRDSAVCGFDYHDNKTQVMVRAGCLALEKHFLHFFGVSSCSDDLRRLLCDLRKFLFVNSDGCIASGLVIDPDTPRGAVDLLQPYVDANTMRLLLRKGEAALTPMKSAVQVRSIEPLDPPASGPLVNNLSRKRAKSTELTESSSEKSEEDPFGTVSKRPKN